MFNLAKAVTIVFVVLIIAMGRKTGLIIGLVLFLTIMATFLVMYHEGRPADGAHLARRAHHRALHAHGQRHHCHRGDQGRDRIGPEQARSRPRSGRGEPVAALRGDRHRRDRLRGDRPLAGFHRRIHQLALLGHLDRPDPELDLVGHRHAAPELHVFQAPRGQCKRREEGKKRSLRGFAVSDLPEAAHSRAPLPLGRGDPVPRGLRGFDLWIPES